MERIILYRSFHSQTDDLGLFLLLALLLVGAHIANDGEEQHEHGQNQDTAGDGPGKENEGIALGQDEGPAQVGLKQLTQHQGDAQRSDREAKLATLYKKQDELRTQLKEIEDEIYQIELELFTKRG